jgi:hypothetical protein
MRQPGASASARNDATGTIYNLAGITVLVLLLAVGAAYLVDRLARASQAPHPGLDDGEAVTQMLSGRELTIPQSWFRFGEQLRDGFTSQIDLRVELLADDGVTLLPVNVALMPRSRARTSASLLDAVYLHAFAEETLSGVPGLVGKPLIGNPILPETVWYDAIAPNPFVAKCIEGVGEAPAQCVRTVYLPSGIAATYAFDANALPSWRVMDKQMQVWLEKIGAW